MPSTTSHSERLKHGLLIPNVGETAEADTLFEFAVAAEEAGWDGIFFGDHLIYPWFENPDQYHDAYDPWITFAGIATQTSEIKLGTWVTPVPRRQPWQLARNLATLDRLSNGRVMLGAGLGTTPDFTKFGRSYDTRRLGEQFDEALEVIAGLWRGEPFSYDGEYYTVDEAVLRPTPVQEPRIPILIGGWWPFKAAFHRGARWDGILPNWPSLIEEDAGIPVEKLPEHIQEAVSQRQSHKKEVSEMLEYYHGLTDQPGEIILPTYMAGTTGEFLDTCEELGATWLLGRSDSNGSMTRTEIFDNIRNGPSNV